jgi:FAD/FMN-containing dehydrogenase
MKRRAFVRSTLTAAAAVAIPADELFGSLYRPLGAQVPPDIEAVTGDGREVTLSGEAVADLAARLRGRVLLGGQQGYDDARRVLNPSFDRYPALIAQPTGAADVGIAVDFARENGGLLLAVKCGGHSASGKSTCDRGMMIDLSTFRSARADPAALTARVTGGSLLGLVDHETMAHGLVTPMGTVSHTGIGGLVTGGGFGRLARRFGLSVDNLISVDVVGADGQLRRASDTENPDLFWGVRGGGGNFGVVTSFEFRLHPMQREVVGGLIMFPFALARDVLTLYGDYGPDAPDELQLDPAVVLPPGGADGMAGFSVCYSGRAADAERALAPVRRLGTPVMDQIQSVEYVALQRSGDIGDPRAIASYLYSGFISELPPALVDAILAGLEPHPARTTSVFFQQGGGAIGRVPGDATAFPQRDSIANMMAAVEWRQGDASDEHVAWIRQYWRELEPFTQGFYVNDQDVDATAADVRDAFRQNHERLVEVKNRYDPENLFRLNANVQPTV